MQWIVYKYTSPSGKIYIGKTSRRREKRRKIEHMNNAYGGSKTHFHKAIRKYGFDNFKYEVLAYVCSEETAFRMEEAFIKQFDSKNNGYNLTNGGEGAVGYKHTDESKVKIGMAVRGERNPFYGKKHSEETKALIGMLGLGKNTGSSNPMAKPKEYYETKSSRRNTFKIICSRQGWNFEDFEEVFAEWYEKGRTKTRKYFYFQKDREEMV